MEEKSFNPERTTNMKINKTIDKALAHITAVAVLPQVALTASAQGVFHLIGEWRDNNKFRGVSRSLALLNEITARTVVGAAKRGLFGYLSTQEYLSMIMHYTPEYTATMLQALEGYGEEGRQRVVEELREAYADIGTTVSNNNPAEERAN